MAERYFGPLAARPLPPLPHTKEPPQPGTKTALVESPAQPLLVLGYKRPDQYDKDDPVFDLLAMILSSGRTSWMYRELVEDKRIALTAQAVPTYPDGRYPNLFVFFVAPAQGHGVDENLKAMDELIERFKAQKVDAAALARVKAQARAQVLHQLADNAQLASLLAAYQAGYGDWRKLFTTLDDYAKVTADDVQRVARQYLVAQGRTLAYTTPPPRPARPAAKGGPPMKRALLALALAAAWAGAQTPPVRKQPPAARPAGSAQPAATPPAAPSVKDLKYPPLKPLPVPNVATFTLPNG